MAKVHELFRKFLNAIFDIKLLSMSAFFFTFLTFINTEIAFLSRCLEMRFWYGRSLFATSEFICSLVVFNGMITLLFVFFITTRTFRFEPLILANYHLRFPKIKKDTVCMLILLNVILIPMALNRLGSIDACLVICSHVCDAVGFSELAERLYSFDNKMRSYYVEKWNYSSRISGVLDPDLKIDRIISSVHGAESANMAERHIQLSRFYRKNQRFSDAIEEADKALAFYESGSTFGTVNALVHKATSYADCGNTEMAKALLLRSVRLLDFSPDLLDNSIENLARLLGDHKSLGEINELKKVQSKIEHPQFLNSIKSEAIGVQTFPLASLFWGLGLYSLITMLGWRRYSFHSIPGMELELRYSSLPGSLELLQDLIAIELFYKNYEAVDRHSRRFLELCQEAA